MSTVEWNDEWGTKDENCVLEDVDSLEGYKVGEEIVLTEDIDDGMYQEGEEGRIVAISEVGSEAFGNRRKELLVLMEGAGEPIGVSPYVVEGVYD